LVTTDGRLPYDRLVLALGSRPNDFDIPGLADRVLHFWSADDADHVLQAVTESVERAAHEPDLQERQRLMTVVIGGAGATGVELAGELAEELPQLARRYHVAGARGRVILIEAGPTILAGSSRELIARARQILHDLEVDVRTNAMIAEATSAGFKLKSGDTVAGGVFIWAGGVQGPEVDVGSCLPIGTHDRIKVDQYLRVLDHPTIYAAGDLAAAVNAATGRVLPPLAQIALDEGEAVAHNLLAEIEGRPLQPFVLHDRGIVVSVGEKSGVADVAGRTLGGRLAHLLKDAIEWEYRQSVKHLRGWSVV
jgi:NADH dehydrogenase